MQELAHEKILIEGLKEGNTKIYDYIFSYFYSGLVAFAIKYVDSKDIAEDVVQEFFLKLWNDREKFSINQSLKSYLFSSIKNRCFDIHRHKEVIAKAKDHFIYQAENNNYESDSLVESELRDKINRAIENLPEKTRKAFIMNRFEGLKPAEIAEKTNTSVRTVEGHIGKALKLLRADLQQYLPAYILAWLLGS